MDLTTREAATLLGISERAVRGRLRKGGLPGVKRGNQWCIPRDRLPLDETQRRALQTKADEARAALEAALPSRVAGRSGKRSNSVADLDPFRIGGQVLAEMERQLAEGDATPGVRAGAHALRSALLVMCEGHHEYERSAKLDALRRSRGRLSRCVGHLLLPPGDPLADPLHRWIQAIETEVLPRIGGLLRWVERLPRRHEQRETS